MQLCDPHLGHGGIGAAELAAHEQADAMVDEDTGDGGFGLDLGQLELRVLELGQRLAEHLALGGVGDGLLQHGFHHSGRADRLCQPLLRQVLHHQFEAAAFGAEQVAGRNVHVLEKQFRGVLRFHAELVEVAAALEARSRGLDNEQRDAGRAAVGLGFGGQHDHIAQLAVGDEYFLAVDHVFVCAAHGAGVDVAQVAAGMRLGHAQSADHLARDHLGQPGALLILGAEGVDVGHHHLVVHRKSRAGETRARHFLDQHHVEQGIGTGTAVIFGDRAAQQPGGAGLAPEFARHHADLLPVGVVGGDLDLNEAPDRVAELFVLGAEKGSLHHGPCRVLI